MSVSHHLDDATVLRYAAGDLDEAFAIVVSSHLTMCDTCRNAVRAAEDMGGELMERCEPTSVEPGSFDALMNRLATVNDDDAIRISGRVARDPGSDVPAPLARHVGKSLDGIAWKTIAPGVRKHDIALDTDGKSRLYMLSIGPGRAMPEHGHGGDEMTLILSGAYRDEFGRFAAGDIADLDEHVEHEPVVEQDAPCICLVATEAPTRFRGLLMRLLQPIFGV
ncbi:ChrR family anti-sigma-E factor [Tepidamorphus sp. 3E244]|uniref:ChrR family anti-sigma-E factor n=1 Tax=Tepidamorphus sp. 3E244 TaxID=3385498 RepID=UPI0038FC46DC